MAKSIENMALDHDDSFSSRMIKVCNFNPLYLKGFYDNFFQFSLDAMFLADKEGRIVWVNDIGKQLMSMGNDFSPLRDQESGLLAFIRKAVLDALESQQEFQNREESYTIDGKILTFLWDGRLIREKRQVAGMVLIAKDITKNKFVHEETIRYNMYKIIDQVASGLAHEIRNPLTAVRGFIQLIHESLKVPSKKEYLQVALDELDRANNFIKDFLLFVRPAAPNFSLVPLDNIIGEAIARLNPQALMKGLQFEFNAPGDSPLMYLDEAQIGRALGNIIQNAVDFTDHGKIQINVINNAKSDNIIITVKDPGCGIPRRNLSHIYEPFFTTKDEAPGLGLTLARTIISNHGGEISISNNQDKGVTVKIKLCYVSTYPDLNPKHES